jgi:hypothetical protein
MYNVRVQRRQSRKRNCRRNRKMYGGGTGLSYAFGSSVDPSNPSLGNGATVIPFSSCGAAVSSSRINDVGTMGGVPGFSSKMYGGSSSMVDPIDSLLKLAGQAGSIPGLGSKQNGGSYSMMDPIDSLLKLSRQTGGGYTMGAVGGPNPFMNRSYSGCGEGAFAVRNPLNEVAPSMITAPPALKGGRRSRKCWSRRMNGGAAVDAMLYDAPRAGYTFTPSNSSGGNAGTLSDGKVPFAVAVPYTAQPTASSACIKTGGRRKSSRKNRKNRRGSRKSRRN